MGLYNDLLQISKRQWILILEINTSLPSLDSRMLLLKPFNMVISARVKRHVLFLIGKRDPIPP